MEMLVTKFSNGKYRNENELFDEPISKNNVKFMGEMIALHVTDLSRPLKYSIYRLDTAIVLLTKIV